MMKKGSQRKLQEGQQQQEGQCRVRPKVLCLGVSYACIKQSAKQAGVSLPQSVIAATSSCALTEQQQRMDTRATTGRNAGGIFTSSNDRLILPSIENDNNDNNNNINNDIKQITNIIQECVQSNILTQMDGRDLIRCLITERVCHVDIYTVSQECGAIYNNQRHLHANFNRCNFVSKLKRHFSGDNNNSNNSTLLLFDQIILDYYWIPLGWDAEHWTRTFFAKVLIDLCNVLQPNHGVIYLPFCSHCFKQVLVCRDILTLHYNISFVRRNKPETTTTSCTRDDDDVNDDDNVVEDKDNESIEQIYLWKGTQQINAKIMQGVFGKRLNQEEIYCTFGPRNLSEDMEDVAISKDNVLDTCKRLEDFHDIRFIALRRIPHHVVHEQNIDEDDSSVVENVDDNNVVDVTPPSSSSSSSSSVRYASSDPATSVPAVPVTALPLTQQPRQPHGSLVSRRRIVPLRTCRQPKSAIFNKPSPPPSAVKKVLFPSKNKVGRPKKKHKNNNNNTIRGSILGLQDPRTIQRGFFCSSTSSITAANSISSGGDDNDNNGFAITSIRSSATTSNTTTRVVTPTPATGRSKIFKEPDDDDDVKKTGKRRLSSPLPLSTIQDGDDDEMAKKPKALF